MRILCRTWKKIASNITQALIDLPNTKMVQVYYHLRLITADPDDDKFVDCAFKANAKYIVTQDHHYDVLRQTPFPRIEVVDIEEFLRILRWFHHYFCQDKNIIWHFFYYHISLHPPYSRLTFAENRPKQQERSFLLGGYIPLLIITPMILVD